MGDGANDCRDRAIDELVNGIPQEEPITRGMILTGGMMWWTSEKALKELRKILPVGVWTFNILHRYDLTDHIDWQLTVKKPGQTLTVELREEK